MILIVYLAIAVVYFTASWVVRRKSGLIGMLLVLLVATVVFAYGMYRYACSLPLACDVGGREAELYYLTHVTRAYAVTGVVGFGAGSVAANMWSERSTRQLPSPKELVGGAGIVFAGLVIAALVMESLGSAT